MAVHVFGANRAEVCRIAAEAALDSKQWNVALRWSSEFASLQPANAIALYNSAVASNNLGLMTSSWAFYQKAKELNPALVNKDIENRHGALEAPVQNDSGSAVDSLDMWYNEAVSMQEQNNDTGAEQMYKNILKQNPAYSHAWNNLGAVYSARGQLQDAVNCFLKLLDKRHDIPEAYANLVNVYLAQDSIADAKRWIYKGLGHNPDNQVLKDLDVKVKEAAKANDTSKPVSITRKNRSK
jgi:tetratricopeptide (TPR) repeat protein